MQAKSGASLTDAKNGATGRPAPSPRHLAVLAACAGTAYVCDQLTKAWAVHSLVDGQSKDAVGSLLHFRLLRNPGAAFSFATNATWLLSVIAAAVIIAVLVTARRLRSLGWAAAFGLVVGGALGNLTDRFVRSPGGGRGAVVDFLELPHWPVFNIADCSICVAAAIIFIMSLRGIGLDGRRDADKATAAEDQA